MKTKELIKAVERYLKENGNGVFDSVRGYSRDVVRYIKKNPETRIVTASNPSFSPDGGFRYLYLQKVQWQPKKFSWDDHLFYAVSVNDKRVSINKYFLRLAVGLLGFSHNFTPILRGLVQVSGGLEIDRLLRS